MELATRWRRTLRSVAWAKAGAETGKEAGQEAATAHRGRATAAPRRLGRNGAAGHFMRNTKGLIVSMDVSWTEGLTGVFFPETPPDQLGGFPVVLLPEVGKETWTTGLLIHRHIVYVRKALLGQCRTEARLRKSAPRVQLAKGARSGAHACLAAVRLPLRVEPWGTTPPVGARGRGPPSTCMRRLREELMPAFLRRSAQ